MTVIEGAVVGGVKRLVWMVIGFVVGRAALVALARSGERGDEVVVYYDGDCGFCHRSVRALIAMDRNDVVRFSTLQSERFAAATASVAGGIDDSIVVIDESGTILQKSDATIHILERLGGPWPFVGALLDSVPRQIRNGVYDLIAANRHRFFERPEDVCPVVPAEERHRFL